jgi:hypothetical protein
MNLNDVLELLKSDEIMDKTITITVNKDGAVTDFSLHDRQKKNSEINFRGLGNGIWPSDAREPYKVTFSGGNL